MDPQPPTDAVERATADLAERLAVPPGAVELVAQEEVTWRDGSLGCAQPGFSYTQALVPGSRITLRVDGTEYEYHAGGRGDPFLCADPSE
ncbi:hypothetical protein [Nocardioides campestrisoli]|uniref:hypothetical protein n=1 Tax=Nocardioides campestrisoli TaxID=2736757 RepID=UPI0015E7D702|nr:hypothetical protein [Nocardioides campestrisoli]